MSEPGTAARRTTAETESKPRTLEFAVRGMTCGSCAGRVQRTLGRQPGVARGGIRAGRHRDLAGHLRRVVAAGGGPGGRVDRRGGRADRGLPVRAGAGHPGGDHGRYRVSCCAGAVEAGSEHPIGHAIATAAREVHGALPAVTGFAALGFSSVSVVANSLRLLRFASGGSEVDAVAGGADPDLCADRHNRIVDRDRRSVATNRRAATATGVSDRRDLPGR